MSRALMSEAVRTLAEVGLSQAQAATVLTMTRNQVAGIARDAHIRFEGAYRVGPGCNSEAALRGWDTRRERGWAFSRAVPPTRHMACARS